MRTRRYALAFLLLAVALGGCAGAARRPAPTPAPTVQRSNTPNAGVNIRGASVQDQGPARYPSPRAGSAYDDPSTGVATVASAIPGAGPVKALVLGNVALIGLTSGDPNVHHRISQQLQSSFPHIVEVRFTQDPAQINRLAEAGQRIRTGRTIAPMLSELGALAGGLPAVQ